MLRFARTTRLTSKVLTRCSRPTSPQEPPKTETAPASDPQNAEASRLEVDTAIRNAEAAFKTAETGLDTVHLLPSAKIDHPAMKFVRKLTVPLAVVLVSAATYAAIAAGYQPSLPVRILLASLIAFTMSFGGLIKQSLDLSGALSAFFVGLGTFSSSVCFGIVLMTFFVSSSALTRVAGQIKANLDADFKKDGQRDWRQVACNGAVPTMLAAVYAYYTGVVDLPLGSAVSGQFQSLVTGLQGAFLGYYSCCCGDTWASEIGILSEKTPRLITSMRRVRKGTNGAVSLLGLVASTAGGLLMGLAFFAASLLPHGAAAAAFQAGNKQWMIIPFGAVAGLLGSLIDSVLGATVQFSGLDTRLQKVVSHPGENVLRISGYEILSNNLVNLCAASTTAAIMGYAAIRLFC